MPTDILRPTTVVSTDFTPSDPLDDPAANLADSDDGTYNSGGTTGDVDAFRCGTLPVDRWKVTAAPDIIWRALNTVGGTARVWWKLGVTTVNGTTETLTGSMQTFTQAAIARPGGGSWTPADFEDLEWGYEIVSDGGGDTRVADLKASVPTSVYDSQPVSTRRIGAFSELPAEPVRVEVSIVLDETDIDYVDSDPERIITAGQFTVPGTNVPVYLTFSQESVVNPRS